VNAQHVVPINDYVAGALLPPHLSPFVEEEEGDYVPPERKQMLEKEKELLKNDAEQEDEDEEEEEEEDETERKPKLKSKKGLFLAL